MQIVFQDPYSSLNPRSTVGQIIGAPFAIHKTEGSTRGKVRIDLCPGRPQSGALQPLSARVLGRRQRQRIGVARALALSPKLIVCDEPVSALDVSIQAQILNLLQSLQRDFALTYLFISHGLGVVRHISDRIAVMYLGRRIVELGRLTRSTTARAIRTPRRSCPRCRSRRATASFVASASSSRETCRPDRSAAGLLVPSPLPEGAARHRQGRRGPGRCSGEAPGARPGRTGAAGRVLVSARSGRPARRGSHSGRVTRTARAPTNTLYPMPYQPTYIAHEV